MTTSHAGCLVSAEGLSGAGITLLCELSENGQAYTEPDGVLIPHEEIVRLVAEDQQSLGLPIRYKCEIRIDSHSTLDSQDFSLQWGFYEFRDGAKLDLIRIGSLLLDGPHPVYTLNEPQFRLCEALDEFNNLPASVRSFRGNLVRFSSIKELATAAGAALDRYLQEETAFCPDDIHLSVSAEDDGSIGIAPDITGLEDTDFVKRFDRFPRPREVVTVADAEGRKKRIPFSDSQLQGLNTVKGKRRLSREDAVTLLDDPSSVFDPEVFNLDDFSSRVAEIGLYKPRVYPFITPVKSEWIPGIYLETSPEERVKIVIENEEELLTLESAYLQALRDNLKSVEFKGTLIPTADLDKTIDLARRQLSRPQEPVTSQDAFKDSGETKVLIIKENIETVEHEETRGRIDAIEHRFVQPPNIARSTELLPHQQEGIAWLQSLFEERVAGALLADDMGLGKTIQVLACIDWHHAFKNPQKKPYLVVAPVSLLENWQAEISKFFPGAPLTPCPIYGPGSESTLSTLLSSSGTDHVFLTTYETLRKRQRDLCRIDWAIAVLDEAQKVKTPGTLTTNAAKALKADFKIAVTGTPVENSFVDLWCIVDFCAPGLLGSAKSFAKEYQAPLKDPSTNVQELGRQLRSLLGAYIKRRMKDQVAANLPQKQTLEDRVEMPEVQLERYLEAIEESRLDTNLETDRRNTVLRTIQALRVISDHPYLLDRTIEEISTDELIQSSAKLIATIKILKQVRDRQEKVLVFSDNRKTQRLLSKVITEVFSLDSVHIINGETPVNPTGRTRAQLSRQGCIDDFQSKKGFNVLVISPLAAGFGLNITGANHVIHYTRHWNPAREQQATDRVYRIGQELDVFVHLPIATSAEFKTFDETLAELLERKSSLASSTLYPTEMTEIKPDELYEQSMRAAPASGRPHRLELARILEYKHERFALACCALLRATGSNAELLPEIECHGADVISIDPGQARVFRCVSGDNDCTQQDVDELAIAVRYFAHRYGTPFRGVLIQAKPGTQPTGQLDIPERIDVWGPAEMQREFSGVQLTPSDLAEVLESRLAALPENLNDLEGRLSGVH